MFKYFLIPTLVLILTLCYAETDDDSNASCDCVVDISIIKTFMTEQKAMQLKLDNIMERQTLSVRSKLPKTCADATNTIQNGGIYTIQIDNYKEGPFLVSCVDETYGSLWMVIQRHVDANIDFHRNWKDYKIGFGDLERSFWMGLDKIHAITTSCLHELLIVMKDYNNTRYYAHYDKFAIGAESQDYELVLLGKYTGNAGDALMYHKGRMFTTKDRDNDKAHNVNCAELYTGGWWYDSCFYSHLNGNYSEINSGKGVTWNSIKQNVSLKSTEMLIRPKGNC